jgi:hypothetical protein
VRTHFSKDFDSEYVDRDDDEDEYGNPNGYWDSFGPILHDPAPRVSQDVVQIWERRLTGLQR